jgi:membrane protein implicated in regulation of membrane protease activity
MSADSNVFLIVLGLVAIIAEILLGAITGFELLIIGVFLIISGGIGWISGSLTFALITFAILTLVYVFAGRRYLKNRFHHATTKTNVDTLIGATGTVTHVIHQNKAGQVRIGDEVWRAESAKDHAKGDTVTVSSVSGVTVRVE